MNVFDLTKRPTVLIDVETTGLDPQQHRVIELAAIRWDAGGRDAFAEIVNPGVAVSDEITRLTGITQEAVDRGTSSTGLFAYLSTRFLCDDPLIVAHNATFDLGFLAAELERHGLPQWNGDFVCTCALSRFLLKTPTGRHRLADTCAALGIKLDGAHRALADLEATEQVLTWLWPRAIETCRPLINAATYIPGRPVGYRPPRAVFYPFTA